MFDIFKLKQPLKNGVHCIRVYVYIMRVYTLYLIPNIPNCTVRRPYYLFLINFFIKLH